MIKWSMVLATFLMMFGCIGGSLDSGNPKINVIKQPSASIQQFDTFRMEFDFDHGQQNPFDPDQVNAYFSIETPSGDKLTHPAFFTHDHKTVIRYGREVTRKLSTKHWEGRWTPVEVGNYHWELIVECAGATARTSGRFECLKSNNKGIARVSQSDPRYFETSDGAFLYPLGHATRSPFDQRGDLPDFDVDPKDDQLQSKDADGSLRIAKYETWFKSMSDAGENFCSIWMAPWSLEIEWSPTRAGYDGLGQYNQKHAAQLDQILALAEKYGIYVLLFTTNHGRVSTVVDTEWYSNPHNKTFKTPSDYFDSDESLRSEEKRHRYILARWGYSRYLLGISLCTETNWVDPYLGFQANPGGFEVEGMTEPRFAIPKNSARVREWFQTLAQRVKKMDIHKHILTLQFAILTEGKEFWDEPEFEFAFNNAYTNQFWAPELDEELGRPVDGVADGMLAWSRYVSAEGKPTLIGEWGGHFFANNKSTLETQLHVGSWAVSMTELGGLSGFWWTNRLHQSNMYHHFSALRNFWGDYDRRNKNLRSIELPVLLEFQFAGEEKLEAFSKHPMRNSLGLCNEDAVFAYVYHHHANTSDVPALSSDSILFPIEREAWLRLPECLQSGSYTVEFWDTYQGKLVLSRTEYLSEPTQGDRQIKLPEFRVDLAVKIRK
jgi:hypothetical protein